MKQENHHYTPHHPSPKNQRLLHIRLILFHKHQESLHDLLKEFNNVPKHPSLLKKPVKMLNMKPNTSPFYIPIPKHYKLPIPYTKHPMLLCRRHFTQMFPYAHNFEHFVAQYLALNIHHIFNIYGRK